MSAELSVATSLFLIAAFFAWKMFGSVQGPDSPTMAAIRLRNDNKRDQVPVKTPDFRWLLTLMGITLVILLFFLLIA